MSLNKINVTKDLSVQDIEHRAENIDLVTSGSQEKPGPTATTSHQAPTPADEIVSSGSNVIKSEGDMWLTPARKI